MTGPLTASLSRPWRSSEGPVTEAPDTPRAVVWALAAGIAFMPLLRPSGPGNSSPVDLFLGLGVLVTLAWAISSNLRLHLPYVVPVGMLVAAGALGGLAGPSKGLSLLELFQDLVLLAWCGSLVNAARSPAAFRLMARTWAWTSVLWAAVLVVAYMAGLDAVTGVTDRTGARAALTFGDANLAATYFVLSLLVVAAARTPGRRVLRVGAYALLLAALALTGSNGGFLAIAIALPAAGAITLYRRFGAVPTLVAGAVCAIALAAVLPQVNLAAVQDWARNTDQQVLVDSLGRTDQSTYDREALVEEAQAMFYSDHGLTGWGPRSTKVVLTQMQVPFPKEAHDDYIAALVERGILGALGLVALIAAVAFRVRSLARGRTAPLFAGVLPRTAPLVGAAIAVAVFSTNEQVLHFRHVWALFALVAAYHLWAA